jgi:hypothetical protein
MPRRLLIAAIWIAAIILLVVGIGRHVAARRAIDPERLARRWLAAVPADFAERAVLVERDPPTLRITPPDRAWMERFVAGNGFARVELPLYDPAGKVVTELLRFTQTARDGASLHLQVDRRTWRAQLTAVPGR